MKWYLNYYKLEIIVSMVVLIMVLGLLYVTFTNGSMNYDCAENISSVYKVVVNGNKFCEGLSK
ncbi:hypothetical protein M3649_04050 [Ureibacillus chungkukjangi]|uniref:hypothetical protein n=1 Tax=Ureibacillus chungkukjangi TaxID=1202712 RepID=UPI00204174AD|nr:hypothetical protein [Ureibacillus chungkukjangi]MCM3387305.1 hypothetical protein [Ureibacillus chungkukjangi]